ncbi:carbohydrate ABC transporter permease [Agrobacterium genomosp. 13]|jgi:multiple sugar transport system permease protein|uniref:Sugar ABC transporter n=2 Tax=Rhizobium/Agrobacterium group TaxID=227290 RepID=A0ABP2BNT5_9HYPH|nr:carbohydrate ABC transporter permease [Agrobacterium genomosp. 13]UXS34684.1 carbohydrate ABC transporter permease [Agrobacterium tumefaciens]CUX50235.1 Sugar ABC transporter [Agrobacterium genomosp. 13 str. CFBP 6927]
MQMKTRNRISSLARGLAIALILLVFIGPIVWIVATAFKDPRDVYALRFFFTPTLENIRTAFEAPFLVGERTWNSIVVTMGTLLLSLPIATAAAYAFSRFRFPGGSIWPIGVLATQFIPPVIVIIPLFIAFRQGGLLDTRIALIIANMSFVVPYAIWMIKGFIDSIPVDMEEAAQIDGASRLRAIWDVVVPMALPGIATAGIFCFVVAWNEFFYALVLTRENATTIQVALMSARTERGDAWEIMAAIGLVIILPMLVLSRYVQKYFVKGLVSGSVR